jgi:hypothetical protein
MRIDSSPRVSSQACTTSSTLEIIGQPLVSCRGYRNGPNDPDGLSHSASPNGAASSFEHPAVGNPSQTSQELSQARLDVEIG